MSVLENDRSDSMSVGKYLSSPPPPKIPAFHHSPSFKIHPGNGRMLGMVVG